MLYASQIKLAQQAVLDSDFGKAIGFLESLIPASGEKDLRGIEWNYLANTCRSRLTILTQTSAARALSISPDSKTMAVGSEDGTVRLWDLSSHLEKQVIQAHNDFIWSIAYSPDGRMLASASADATVKIWDSATQELKATLRGHQAKVKFVAFSPDGKHLATVSADGTAKIWDLTGGVVATLNGNQGAINAVRFSPDGKQFATAGKGSIKLWRTDTYENEATLNGDPNGVYGLSYSPDGELLACGGNDPTASIWNTRTLRKVAAFEVGGLVHFIEFSPNGGTLAIATETGVELWDIKNRQKAQTLKGHRGLVWCVKFVGDDMHLATAGSDDRVLLWGLNLPHEDTTFVQDVSPVWGFAFVPGRDELAWFNEKGQLKVASVSTKQEILNVKTMGPGDHGGPYFISNGRYMVSPGDGDVAIKLWDAEKWTEIGPFEIQKSPVNGIAFTHDGARLFSGDEDGYLRVWDLQTRQVIKAIKAHSNIISCASLSFDGNKLLTAGFDGLVKLWDASTLQNLGTIRAHSGGINNAMFSPDGKQIATVGNDGLAKLWDSTTLGQLGSFTGHSGGVVALAFSPDGTRLVTGGADYTIKIWDLSTQQELLNLTGHKAVVYLMFFSPDGRLLASCSKDGSIRFWRFDRG